MYLSRLLIDMGDDPDRPRPGRVWLYNRYHVHQRLCMAFPSKQQTASDPEFLKPYAPDGFKHVHGMRTDQQGMLFRIESVGAGDAGILVQSALEPRWGYAFHNAPHFLAADPQVKVFDPQFQAGEVLAFRLEANPTTKIGTLSRADRLAKKTGRHGTRVPVKPTREDMTAWLVTHATDGGFTVNLDSLLVQPGYAHMRKPLEVGGRNLRSVRFDGVLTVTGPDKLRRAVISGIGSAKAFGFGLLSVAPLPEQAA